MPGSRSSAPDCKHNTVSWPKILHFAINTWPGPRDCKIHPYKVSIKRWYDLKLLLHMQHEQNIVKLDFLLHLHFRYFFQLKFRVFGWNWFEFKLMPGSLLWCYYLTVSLCQTQIMFKISAHVFQLYSNIIKLSPNYEIFENFNEITELKLDIIQNILIDTCKIIMA